MIEYKFPEEKEFILHYAKKLNQPLIEKIVNDGYVSSSQEASALAKFFWEMVDAIVEDKRSSIAVAGQTDLEAWNEYMSEGKSPRLKTHFSERKIKPV